MWASLRVLGIESTCDETAAAVVEADSRGRGKILSNCVLSQIAEHAAFGGVVPEIAARAHVEALDPLIRRALAEADCRIEDLDAIAAAAGPGLIGGVMVGLTTGKAIALAAQQAVHRGQPPRSPCVDAAPDRGDRIPLSAAAGLGRTQPAGRGPWRRRLSKARLDGGRRRRRGLRQGGQTAWPALSRRPARRTDGARRRPDPFRLPAADGRAAQSRLFLLRPQDGGAAGGGTDRAPDPDRCRRSLRLVPGGGRGRDHGPLPGRLAPARRFAHPADGAGRRGRRRRQWRDPPGARPSLRGSRVAAGACRRRTCARTMAR